VANNRHVGYAYFAKRRNRNQGKFRFQSRLIDTGEHLTLSGPFTSYSKFDLPGERHMAQDE
jgi:hypothetical protein